MAATVAANVAKAAPLLDVLRHRKDSEQQTKEESKLWLERHPEVNHIISDFVVKILSDQPADVFAYAREHFAPAEAPVPR